MKSWQFKNRVTALKKNTYALYLASQDPGVPVLAKIIIGLVVAYVLSPIDLVPDFIPVLGYLDDLILLPLGIWLSIRLVPQETWRECQALAAEQMSELPCNHRAAIVICVIWVLAMAGFTLWAWPYLGGIKST